MGAARTYRPGVRVSVSKSGGGGSAADHPLLALQRAAGNRAVAGLVQREAADKPYIHSKVALAPIEALYAGKCDAKTSGAAVRHERYYEIDGKSKRIVFDCGPRSFEFKTHYPWLGGQYPWSIETADDSTAWTTQAVHDALDDISDDIGDTGPKFWKGYHTVQGALADDLGAFCADQR